MKNGDTDLVEKAQSALAKINTVLPKQVAEHIQQNALHPIAKTGKERNDNKILICIRRALRENRTLTFDYINQSNQQSQRTIYPITIGYFEGVRLLAGWCELREDFRHFRTDRMTNLLIGTSYSPSRKILEQQWEEKEGIQLHKFDL